MAPATPHQPSTEYRDKGGVVRLLRRRVKDAQPGLGLHE